MLKIREAIVVEGRYDKNTLSQVVDTVILETAGFGIFRDEETLALLRRIGAKRGLILLTDSDGAGFLIRNYLKGALPQDQVKHAYIPDRYGKERRKRRPGKEGKLGVEGMPPAVLEAALRQAGATVLGEDSAPPQAPPLTKADLYACGLSGGRAAGKSGRSCCGNWTCHPTSPPTPCFPFSPPCTTGTPCWRRCGTCDSGTVIQVTRNAKKTTKYMGEWGLQGPRWGVE